MSFNTDRILYFDSVLHFVYWGHCTSGMNVYTETLRPYWHFRLQLRPKSSRAAGKRNIVNKQRIFWQNDDTSVWVKLKTADVDRHIIESTTLHLYEGV